MKKRIAVIAILLLLSACSANTDSEDVNTNQTGQNQSTDTAQPTPGGGGKVNEEEPAKAATPDAAAAAVMQALKEKDMGTLSAYIHPAKGLLFSPYAHIDTATAKVFPAKDFPALTDKAVYNWGTYDGSGELIELTFQQYYDKFVYDKDFMKAETVGADQIIGKGNMLVNIKDIFPGSYVMDYYFSGFDPQYEGMDWESLILVLEELDGAWYVSAVVHSQWTI